jgi:hypothetical protein
MYSSYMFLRSLLLELVTVPVGNNSGTPAVLELGTTKTSTVMPRNCSMN